MYWKGGEKGDFRLHSYREIKKTQGWDKKGPTVSE